MGCLLQDQAWHTLVFLKQVPTVKVRKTGSRPVEPDPDSQAEGASNDPAWLYHRLWHTLDDVVGSVATVTLLRRAARRAAPTSPLLLELATTSVDDGFSYQLPRFFLEPEEGPAQALDDLVAALRTLLVELTGLVVVQQVDRISGLRRPQAPATEEAPP